MDYRSYVSSAKNKTFKVVLFVLLFFSFSFNVYASDIIIGSNDIEFSFVPAAYFVPYYEGYYAYASSATGYGSIFCVPKSDITNNKIFFYNPDLKSYNYYVRGSASSSITEGMVRGTGSNRSNNSFSSASTKLFSSPVIRDELLEVDVSSWDNYDYYFISVVSGATSGIGVSNVRIYSRALAPTPSPTATPSPTSLPDPTPGISPSPGLGSSPTPGSETLQDHAFWATCYDQIWKNGLTAPKDIKQRYVPSLVSDLSSTTNGIYSYVYTYSVRIPFRVECVKFYGEGFFDANFSFDLNYSIFGLPSSGINSLVDFSTPWIESIDPLSFNASNTSGNFGFDVINVPLHNGTSAEFYFCFDIYVSLSAPNQFSNYADYVDITLSNVSFDVLTSKKVTDLPSDQILNDINNNIVSGNEQQKQFHEEEVQEAQKAVDQLNSGLSDVTNTLTSWEIVSMPFTVVQDLVGALQSDGSTGLTFPSFSLMGYQLWPSYTFDLNFIKENFPVLYNSLHIITGIMVVSWFLHYLWRKWHILTGDDTPEV